MCNICNTGYNFGQSGCGYATGYYGCNRGSWGCGTQSVCRDCNGNLRIIQRNTNNCCRCSNCWHHDCGCNQGNGTATEGNGNNGRFTCVTFCGTTNGFAATPANGDLYYARQYGLRPRGNGCSCGFGTND